MAFFSDGGFSAAKGDVTVVPSDRTLAALIVQAGGETGVTRISLPSVWMTIGGIRTRRIGNTYTQPLIM
jgi:hypothetical protein